MSVELMVLHGNYGCVYSRLAVRAIHLEWVSDISTIQFLNCLRRFVARRGVLYLLYSANASQFKLANSALDKARKELQVDSEVLSYLSKSNIKW